MMKNNNTTELVMILDKSGSMHGLEKDTIGGYNSMLDKQKKEDGEVLVSTVLFDDRSRVVHDRVPLRRIEPLDGRQYCPGGCTALLDALGGAIDHIASLHRHAGEYAKPDKTIFVIITDGLENASTRYGYHEVRRMIERQKEAYRWEFFFLGANMDAVQTAGMIGIREDRAADYICDRAGTALNFEVISDVVCSMRAGAGPVDASWKGKLKEDYEARR